MRRRSITFRLTLFFSTVSTAVLLVAGYVIGTMVEAHFEDLDLIELDSTLGIVRRTLAEARKPIDMAALPKRLSRALVGHLALPVVIVGSDRRVLFASTDAMDAIFPAHLLERPPHEDSPGQARPVTWEKEGLPYRGVVASAVTGNAGQAPVTVVVARNIEHHQIFMETFQKNLWSAIAASIALTAILGWIAAYRGLTPVREMADVAHGISASSLGDRLRPESVPSELVEVAIAFNAMLDRLDGSFRRLSAFSSDLAHELRTPISNLMTETQVAISKTRSADQYREVLYSNLEEYERLARMITDMLFLAKADNGLIVPTSEMVDLAVEARELFGFYEGLAEELGVGLVLAGEGVVRGDSLMIRRALSNLLSNAIRHTPRGGSVKVLIDRHNSGETRLTVENPGEDIAPAHLPRLCDRFYRVDYSRQKASEGVGLGLAITKSIVEAHKGTMQIFSSNGSTRFAIAFPPPGVRF